MEVQYATAMASKIAHLIAMCSSFQAKYGSHYHLKPGSQPEAWALFNEIVELQLSIAQMLATDALEKPHVTIGKWWERFDIPDLAVSKHMMDAVTQLISATAYDEATAQDGVEWSYNVKCSQRVIAGLLHPNTIQIALSQRANVPQRVAG